VRKYVNSVVNRKMLVISSFSLALLTQPLNCAERLICPLSVSGKEAFVAASSLSARGEPHGESMYRITQVGIVSAEMRSSSL
jgi:hypothetical protein